MRHGTKYSYDQGCRCDECRAAKMRSHRESRARSRAANTPGYQHELALGRALKERYRGTCVDCGAPTTGCNGPEAAPERCNHCAPRLVQMVKRGSGPTQQRIIAAIQERGRARFTEIMAAAGISKEHAAVTLNRLVRYGLIERVSRGVYVVASDAAYSQAKPQP